MPPKAKRYRVWFKDPILNTWRAIATELTKAEADKLTGQIFFEARKELIEDE